MNSFLSLDNLQPSFWDMLIEHKYYKESASIYSKNWKRTLCSVFWDDCSSSDWMFSTVYNLFCPFGDEKEFREALKPYKGQQYDRKTA